MKTINKIIESEGNINKYKYIKCLRKLGYGKNMSKEIFFILSKRKEAERAIVRRASRLNIKPAAWLLTRTEYLSYSFRHKKYSTTQAFKDHRNIFYEAYNSGKLIPEKVSIDYLKWHKDCI